MPALYGPLHYRGDDWAPDGLVHHYTRGHALHKILKDGCLKPRREHPSQTRGLVWFSRNNVWEAGASRPLVPGAPVHGDFETQAAMAGGLVRITVEQCISAPLDLRACRQVQGPYVRSLQAQLSSGGLLGRQNIWFGSTRPVPRSEWWEIAVWRKHEWIPLDFSLWGYPPADVEGAAKVP